ncbi:hypothetical protein PAXRUDRAFT_825827 [Paxillus rubicundulus Ve08.2h10]|uniref:Uncharacterized protein n=1 Tax=Paxillus rubicundulus Ve08.2h10 TaxID=930991 RepID=A0A0D0EAF2_9AGAM|nr:hypothetical protein PAXRUDRAFT_825827 [Paxillus rubicundulus Ve08.2h10]
MQKDLLRGSIGMALSCSPSSGLARLSSSLTRVHVGGRQRRTTLSVSAVSMTMLTIVPHAPLVMSRSSPPRFEYIWQC